MPKVSASAANTLRPKPGFWMSAKVLDRKGKRLKFMM